MIFAAGAVGLGWAEASSTNAGDEGYQHWANGMEKLTALERQRLEELLNSRGMQRGSYPPFTVDVRGPKVFVKFKVPPMCEVSRLIVDLVLHLGLKVEQCGGGSEMILHALCQEIEFIKKGSFTLKELDALTTA